MARSVATLVASMALDSASFVTDIDRASRRSTAALKKFERQVDRAGKAIGAALGAGLAVAISEAIRFESAMAEVSTLLDDTSGLDATTDAVKRLSVEFGQAPVDQAKALYQIISAGASDAAQQVELLTASNKLALGGVTDVRTAADGLTTVLNAYAGTGLTAAEVSDSLFTTMKQGKTTIEELSSSIGNVATIAAQTGVSLDEIGAAVGTLTKSGIATGEAMNALRGVLAAVLKQSEQSKKAAAELGVEFSVAALQSKGFAEFLQQIADSGATEEQLAKLFGRVEGLSAVMALGANEAAEFTAQLEAQAKAAGATGDAVEKMADTTAFKISQATSAIRVLSIEIGEGFLSAISSSAVGAVENIDKIRKFIIQLVEAFKVLGAVATAIGAIIVSTFSSLFTLAKTAVLPVIDLLTSSLEIAVKTAAGNITGALKTAQATVDQFNKRFVDAGEALKTAGGFTAEAVGQIKTALDDAAGALNEFDASVKASSKLPEELGNAIGSMVDEILDVPGAVDKSTKSIDKNTKALDKNSKEWKKLSAEISSFVDDVLATDAFDDLVTQVEDLIDTLDPVGAQFRKFAEMAKFAEENAQLFRNRGLELEEVLGLIDRQARETILGMLGLADGSKTAADQVVTDSDRMREAALEAVRQMTSAFLGMWQDIISGGEDAFDGLISGLENLLAQFAHSISTAQIGQEFQNLLDGKGFSFQNFAGGLASSLGLALGAELGGGGQGAGIGSAIGGIIGKAALSKLFAGLGSFAGPLGTILGSLAGGLLGGLFDDEGDIRLQIVGSEVLDEIANYGNRRTAIETELGGFIISNANRLGEDAVNQISKSVSDFDAAIAAFLSPEQAAIVTENLQRFGREYLNEQISVQEIIGDRFGVILSSFSSNVQDFVNDFSGLEKQVEALGVAATAQRVFDELPELFGDRSFEDFLGVIRALASEVGSLEGGFEKILSLLDVVGGIQAALQDFSASDPAGDFQALIAAQNRTAEESLSLLNQQLLDAINNFDGSVDSLSQIGQLSLDVREGELRLLQQIDDVQKGLAARLQSLRDLVTGVTEGPQTITGTLLDAEGLLRELQGASSAAEVANIGQQFDALIRGLTEDQTALAQSDLLRLIDAFEELSTQRLEALRDDALSNADVLRSAVDDFIIRVGDPLDIIAQSLDGNINESLNEGFNELAENNNQNTDRLIQAIYAAQANGQVIVVQDSSLVNQ